MEVEVHPLHRQEVGWGLYQGGSLQEGLLQDVPFQQECEGWEGGNCVEMGVGSPGEGVGRAGPEMGLCVLASGEGGRGREGGRGAGGVSKAGGTRGQITSLGFVGRLRKGGLPTSESHWEVESRRVKASAS